MGNSMEASLAGKQWNREKNRQWDQKGNEGLVMPSFAGQYKDFVFLLDKEDKKPLEYFEQKRDMVWLHFKITLTIELRWQEGKSLRRREIS